MQGKLLWRSAALPLHFSGSHETEPVATIYNPAWTLICYTRWQNPRHFQRFSIGGFA
jgi:hypothetical protein